MHIKVMKGFLPLERQAQNSLGGFASLVERLAQKKNKNKNKVMKETKITVLIFSW